MSESIIDHGYLPEEHAPDPVISHGDPTAPGKIGIWLFLASEVMFFVAILGAYVIFRGGSPGLFEKHSAVLSKAWAAINTLVLISSSLTMALAVDASQKGNTRRVASCLALTLLCALLFLGIKTIEYSDKAHHFTIIAHTDEPAPVVVKTSAAGPLYLIVSRQNKDGISEAFNGDSFEPQSASHWKKYAIPLAPRGSGTVAATVPAAAAGYGVTIYNAAGAVPTRKDPVLNIPAEDIEAGTGIWVYDGHVHDSGSGYLNVHGYRMPMRATANGGALFDIHLLSESDVERGAKAAGEGDKPKDYRLESSQISDSIRYGPGKNLFYASYFTLTGIHGLHVVGGVIALCILLAQSLRGRLFPAHTEYVGLYWHFVDLVWIFLFPLLYLI